MHLQRWEGNLLGDGGDLPPPLQLASSACCLTIWSPHIGMIEEGWENEVRTEDSGRYWSAFPLSRFQSCINVAGLLALFRCFDTKKPKKGEKSHSKRRDCHSEATFTFDLTSTRPSHNIIRDLSTRSGLHQRLLSGCLSASHGLR